MERDESLSYGRAVEICRDYAPLAPVTAYAYADEEADEEIGCDSCRYWRDGRCQAHR
ncbi:MAG: hypothetical protein ACM3XS_07570 [Bacteroidota bacterium]